MASSSEAQIKSEIERLTATINHHKAQKNKTWNTGYGYSNGPFSYGSYHSGSAHHQGGPPARTNTYVNPNYRPANNLRGCFDFDFDNDDDTNSGCHQHQHIDRGPLEGNGRFACYPTCSTDFGP
ncbi:hypothetical protein NLJ89_g1913 [Agrocybe chaxingu]|uniref:Uncharacterized protein n=1 Tax=Agrocybe chaxingu TaxID=84603 RepID=A0A9W8MZ53_9AGAR|nr:hypothetical protein NLJ89_g1913 [Agrocybe chaxingu]